MKKKIGYGLILLGVLAISYGLYEKKQIKHENSQIISENTPQANKRVIMTMAFFASGVAFVVAGVFTLSRK